MSSETVEKKSWSELNLAPYPFSAAVIFDEEIYERFCTSMEFKDRTWIEDNNQGDVCAYGSLAIVRFDDLTKLKSYQQVGVFAHEATHVFQALCLYISESDPSAEFQAYTIQAITQWLFKEYSCYQLSTSDSSEQPSSSPSSEEESGTSAPSEATLPTPEPESQS